jgi:ATP-dependent RNA helicase RhlE
MNFSDLGLAEPILRAVAAEGYHTPTPIQEQAIPLVSEGRDVLGCAQTGTGKTAAFALPILNRLMEPGGVAPKRHGRRPRVLVLSPTRELACQIGDSFQTYGRHTRLRETVIYGGVNQNRQTRALEAGTDIIVATPGRLLDLINQGFVHLASIEIFVLDEADRMLDMGFIPDIRRIVSRLPANRQTLFFSATMPSDIRQLADTILKNPATVQVAAVSSAAETVDQSVYLVDQRNKSALLKHFLEHTATGRTLVFTRTKSGADRVAKHLVRAGMRAEAIHGDKSQSARAKALASFKSQHPPVLVATDVAARGLDIDEIAHVVNYELPNVPETYVHRIGRTGRAGASGIAVSFCDREERAHLRAIERLLGKRLTVLEDQPVYPKPEQQPQRKPVVISDSAVRAGNEQGRHSRPARSGVAARSGNGGAGGGQNRGGAKKSHGRKSYAKHTRYSGSGSI